MGVVRPANQQRGGVAGGGGGLGRVGGWLEVQEGPSDVNGEEEKERLGVSGLWLTNQNLQEVANGQGRSGMGWEEVKGPRRSRRSLRCGWGRGEAAVGCERSTVGQPERVGGG